MLPLKNTLLTKYPLLFSKKMKDTVNYFEWNLLSELITQANVNADLLINKADLVHGKVPLEQLPDLTIDLTSKADLVHGKVPLEQLPELASTDQIHIGAVAPDDKDVILWLKLE